MSRHIHKLIAIPHSTEPFQIERAVLDDAILSKMRMKVTLKIVEPHRIITINRSHSSYYVWQHSDFELPPDLKHAAGVLINAIDAARTGDSEDIGVMLTPQAYWRFGRDSSIGVALPLDTLGKDMIPRLDAAIAAALPNAQEIIGRVINCLHFHLAQP